jgi:hypothetical protein
MFLFTPFPTSILFLSVRISKTQALTTSPHTWQGEGAAVLALLAVPAVGHPPTRPPSPPLLRTPDPTTPCDQPTLPLPTPPNPLPPELRVLGWGLCPPQQQHRHLHHPLETAPCTSRLTAPSSSPPTSLCLLFFCERTAVYAACTWSVVCAMGTAVHPFSCCCVAWVSKNGPPPFPARFFVTPQLPAPLVSTTQAELAAATGAAAGSAGDGTAASPHQEQLAGVEQTHAQLSEEQLVCGIRGRVIGCCCRCCRCCCCYWCCCCCCWRDSCCWVVWARFMESTHRRSPTLCFLSCMSHCAYGSVNLSLCMDTYCYCGVLTLFAGSTYCPSWTPWRIR